MPLSRKKACLACSKSKLRCNRALPACSRCAERDLSCIYDGVGRRSAPYPQFATAPLEDAHDAFNQSLRSHFASLHQYQREQHSAPPSSIGLTGFSDPFMDWGASEKDDVSVNLHLTSPTTNSLRPPKCFNPMISQSVVPSWVSPSLADSQPASLASQLEQQNTDLASPAQSMLVIIPDEDNNDKETTLAQRPFASGTILSSVILGQLTSYPRLLIQGEQLPPFIHPTCFRDEKLASGCSDQGYHVCLSEELSICQTLVRAFYSRTDGNSDFVWKSIYAEKERIRKEYEKYDAQRKLAAAQVLVVFLLMQAEDADSIERNDTAGLLETVLAIAQSTTLSRLDWRFDVVKGTPDRDDWLHLQSIRRLLGILHVVGILLHGIVIPPCTIPNNNHRFTMQPLPCYKSLWEARTSREWRLNWAKYLSGRRTGRTLVVEDVMMADEPGERADVTVVDSEVKYDVVRWCENLDALGMLIYTVLPLERGRNKELSELSDYL